MKNQGRPDHLFDGRPVIGICNTWSELTPCNTHFRLIADHVKRGVYEAGGFPLEFPVMSSGRNVDAAYRNVVSQFSEHGRRGIDPREPDRWCHPTRRVRQNYSCITDGRRELRYPGNNDLRAVRC